MGVTTYFRFWLLVPIIIPVAFGLLAVTQGIRLHEGLEGVLTTTTMYGGIPYLVVAALLSWNSYRVSEDKFVKLILLSPLFVAAITLIELYAFFIFFWLSGEGNVQKEILDPLYMWGIGSVIGVPFAYCYVLVSYLGYRLLKRLGYVTIAS